jgi:hypothetical protein
LRLRDATSELVEPEEVPAVRTLQIVFRGSSKRDDLNFLPPAHLRFGAEPCLHRGTRGIVTLEAKELTFGTVVDDEEMAHETDGSPEAAAALLVEALELQPFHRADEVRNGQCLTHESHAMGFRADR